MIHTDPYPKQSEYDELVPAWKQAAQPLRNAKQPI